MKFLDNNYRIDIIRAAESHPDLDSVNAADIANRYNRDSKDVVEDIEWQRRNILEYDRNEEYGKER